jgi:hypothetical protein
MSDKPWNNSPNALHYVVYKKENGKISTFIERGDLVDQRIERLTIAGLEIINVEKKRET